MNLGNTYALKILEKILTHLNLLKNQVLPTFLQIGSLELSDFGPTPTGRIRTYKLSLVSVSLSVSLSLCASFSPKPRIGIF